MRADGSEVGGPLTGRLSDKPGTKTTVQLSQNDQL